MPSRFNSKENQATLSTFSTTGSERIESLNASETLNYIEQHKNVEEIKDSQATLKIITESTTLTYF